MSTTLSISHIDIGSYVVTLPSIPRLQPLSERTDSVALEQFERTRGVVLRGGKVVRRPHHVVSQVEYESKT
jgi:hypothetical protein